MNISKVVEYIFFFSVLALVGYTVFLIVAPFALPLVMAAIIVTIVYPLYGFLVPRVYKKSESLAAFFSTLIVLVGLLIPIIFVTFVLSREIISLYQSLASDGPATLAGVESVVEGLVAPLGIKTDINVSTLLTPVLSFVSGHIGSIFTGAASLVLLFFLTILATFYLFRDGVRFVNWLIRLSPLPDKEDKKIIERVSTAIRAVAVGTLLVAVTQGVLVSIGFLLFGIPNAVLWGSIASLGALVPGIGTAIVTIPAIGYLFVLGETTMALGLLIWTILIVGMVDNLLAPTLIGKRSSLHPFIILLAVLGGIGLFGPIGFIIGPVVVTLFVVLLELYNQYIERDTTMHGRQKTH